HVFDIVEELATEGFNQYADSRQRGHRSVWALPSRRSIRSGGTRRPGPRDGGGVSPVVPGGDHREFGPVGATRGTSGSHMGRTALASSTGRPRAAGGGRTSRGSRCVERGTPP